MPLKLEDLWNTDGTILLTGESGVGKSYLAKKIHGLSARKNSPFLCLNLAEISENLLESELYGHVKGAFSGAVSGRSGYLECTQNGTLFLDEIAELSLQGQKKLLGVLEERVYAKVGTCHKVPFRGRIIAATNRSLEDLVKTGSFREDLYYRLQVFHYPIPPLRSRPDFLLFLIEEVFQDYKKKLGKPKLFMDSELKVVLQTFAWPGNIRQLKHCFEYMVSLADDKLTKEHLPDWMNRSVTLKNIVQKNTLSKIEEEMSDREKLHFYQETWPISFPKALEKFEKEFFLRGLIHVKGRVNMGAELMQVSKSTLITKARKYGIDTLKMRAFSSERHGGLTLDPLLFHQTA